MPILSLYKKEIPKIKGKQVLEGEQIGGIKLTYQDKSNNDAKVTFLKPFKSIWANCKEECEDPREWGNTSSPLTTVWLKLTMNEDYESIEESFMFIRSEKVTEHALIAALNREEQSIIVGFEVVKIPLI